MTRPQPALYRTAARLYLASERARRHHRPVRLTLKLTPAVAALAAQILAHGARELEGQSAHEPLQRLAIGETSAGACKPARSRDRYLAGAVPGAGVGRGSPPCAQTTMLTRAR